MKLKLLFTIPLIFAAPLAWGQDTLVTDYKDKATAPTPSLVAVELPKMNILYIGVESPLIITGKKNISLSTISSGSIIKSKTDPNRYIIIVTEEILEVTVSIYTKGNGGKNELLEQRNFRIKKLPNPEALFAGKTGASTATKTELLNATEVVTDMGDFPFDSPFKIISFDIVVAYQGKEMAESSASSKVTEKQRDILKLAQLGQKVYIENIKALGPDGNIRNLSPISLKRI